MCPDRIEQAVVTAYEPDKTLPHVFLVPWGGEESELVLGDDY